MNQEQYIKAILKKLKCGSEKKKEIRKELESDIAGALEAGETMEEIMKRMGDASFVASEFNNNFSEKELVKAKQKKILIITTSILIALIVIFAIGFWAIPKSYPLDKNGTYTEEEVIEQAKTIIGYFNAEDYDSLAASSTTRLKQYMTQQGLEGAKSYISDDWGAFLAYGNAYTCEVTQMGNSSIVVQITTTYENTAVTYTLTFDQNLDLAGFYMK
ncbi:MAG: DUF3887 domain-containing protein [Lachnospiraceae bacterium]|nr:DUF3887 domain-containing protein [Lachnospiraceae bacterium]